MSNSNELLPLVVQGATQLVEAKLLHEKLKNTGRYYDWINYRIKEFGFEENVDYFLLKKVQHQKTHGGDRRSTDYHLTLDMAKELCMLEKSEIGRFWRKYFINEEKKVRSILPKEPYLFKGLKPEQFNNRTMYPFKQFLRQVGFSEKSSGFHYRSAYPNHFIVMGKVSYLTEELATQIFHSRRLAAARRANKQMQPVIPFNFGAPLPLTFNQKGGAL